MLIFLNVIPAFLSGVPTSHLTANSVPCEVRARSREMGAGPGNSVIPENPAEFTRRVDPRRFVA